MKSSILLLLMAALVPSIGAHIHPIAKLPLSTFTTGSSYKYRHLEESSADVCSTDPFLYLIKEGEKVVGFGVGTLHAQRDAVVTEEGWTSLAAAAADACTIYGEMDLTDPAVLQQIAETCVAEDPVFLADVSSEELRQAYTDKMIEIITHYLPATPEQVEQQLPSFPLATIQQMIVMWNTPQIRDSFFENFFQGGDVDFLDTDLLLLGQPSASLETIEESCAYIAAITPQKEEFLMDPSSEQTLWEGLNASSTPLVEAYRCGEEEKVVNLLLEGTAEVDNETMDALLDGKKYDLRSCPLLCRRI